MSNNSTESFWLDAWYQGRWWLWLLWPLSMVLRLLAAVRRRHLSQKSEALEVPVIVVGNITLGGTGKTPVIISLVNHLREKGFNPGVLSRGYGAKAPHYPYLVTPLSPVVESGDEPLLIALEAQCPVMIGADRIASARALIDEHQCDILLSDDGLQHYRLSRQWEICVLDATRLWGNGLCLPAGPLREPPKRLAEVDAILLNGVLSQPQQAQPQIKLLLGDSHTLSLKPSAWHKLDDGTRCSIADFEQMTQGSNREAKSGYAVTGIGNPDRFFQTLSSLGVDCPNRSFPDHYAFSASDLAFAGDNLLMMTAKDAVKCRSFARPNWWYLSVRAQLSESFWAQLDDFLRRQTRR
ncbi:MAG: tetraacyldisaccharide 4'-kinase [Cellvibrionaceae bacterium]